MQSKFVVFDGPDGSGTTRNSQALAEILREQGIPVILTVEPTHSPIGKEIRKILHGDTLPSPDAMQLLFCADRAEHVATIIQPALDEGKTIICDRYVLSTIIYGSVLGLDAKWLEKVNEQFPKPDLTIVTLPPYEVCRERIGQRTSADQFENDEFQRRIYDAYRAVEDPTTIFIDTNKSREEVTDDVYRKVRDYFGPLSRETIEQL